MNQARPLSDHPETVLATMRLGEDGSTGLLQDLIKVQQTFNWIPPVAITRLSSQLAVSPAEINGVVSFYSFLHSEPRGQFDVLFSNNITDQMLGNAALQKLLCDRLGVQAGVMRSDGRVTVDTTSCTGLCEQGPAALVNGHAVSALSPDRIEQMAQLIEANTPLSEWPAEWFDVPDNIYRRDLLLNAPLLRGQSIDAFLEQGGEAILSELETSTLRGRGGAGFSTAMKWRFCRDAKGDEHYVVCNADEGEPGTFKDRVLLNRYAHSVFEGMTLCAAVIGSRKGFLYLRGEYLHLLDSLEAVLQERRESGLLGDAIQGKAGFDFDIDIHLGAGAYICGEESALIESLEGKRGIPRNRPPFPVSNGYLQQPTVVNNVETFMAAALIAVNGGKWFAATGTETSGGTKILSVSGDCERPGIYEYPFGTTIQQVLDDCGAARTQAVQIAGAAGSTHPPKEFTRTIAFEDISTGGSFMIFNDSRDLLDMVENFADFFVHESCGFCTPCRVGGSLLRDLVNKTRNGYASDYDLNEMRQIGALMRQSSHCGLGATASNPVCDTLEKFPQLYAQRLATEQFVPAFDLDAALAETRRLSGRNDDHAHLENRHD